MNLYKGRKHLEEWENAGYQKTFLEKKKMLFTRKHFLKRRKCRLAENILGKGENVGYQKRFEEKGKMLVTRKHFWKRRKC